MNIVEYIQEYCVSCKTKGNDYLQHRLCKVCIRQGTSESLVLSIKPEIEPISVYLVALYRANFSNVSWHDSCSAIRRTLSLIANDKSPLRTYTDMQYVQDMITIYKEIYSNNKYYPYISAKEIRQELTKISRKGGDTE